MLRFQADAEGFLGVDLADSKTKLFIEVSEIVLGTGRTNGKWPVTAEQNPALADRLDDGLQEHRRVHDAVDIEFAYGLERLERHVRGSLPPGDRAAPPAPAQSRDASAAVSENDVETPKALHNASENQVRRCNRRFNRIAQQVGQIKGVETLVGRRARVDKERKLALAEDAPQRIEPFGRV